jgi:hypothetical protein
MRTKKESSPASTPASSDPSFPGRSHRSPSSHDLPPPLPGFGAASGRHGGVGRIPPPNPDPLFYPRAILREQSTPQKPMRANPNIPSRSHAVSRTPAFELGAFARDPMKRLRASVPASRPRRRLSVAISLGIAAQHAAGLLDRPDPATPSAGTIKRLAVRRRAHRRIESGDQPLGSLSP